MTAAGPDPPLASAATGAPSMMGCPARFACSAANCDGVAGMAPKAIRRACGHETHGMR